MKIIGIDDAGRGPVIGPMVLTGVLIDDKKEEEVIKKMGAKDSKLLSPTQRKKLSDKIKKDYVYKYEIIEPKEIDDFPNLNNLEAIKSAEIVNKLMKNIHEKVRVVVDCPSVNTQSWGDFLMNEISKKELIELACEHKADFNHPVVSAASIISKETREEELEKLKKELNINFGSGYPADPRTKDFLVETFGNKKYDNIIRKSWSTYKKIADSIGQQKLF